MYIRATGNISPQKSFGHLPLLEELVMYSTNRLSCVEPDYKDFIDARLIRRMSRIIRMGVGAATECLREANLAKPDAIITGTAYGCLEDTGLFLTKMVEYNEELLTPTAFIQSTHNTIGAQIGLMLQCNNYNNAFVHRGFSFESALMDAMMLMKENAAANVLVGAIDEITNISHAILNRMGLYKQGAVSNLDLYKINGKGTIAGEGASFFLLANERSATDYAKLEGLTTIYKPGSVKEIEQQVLSFLQTHATSMNEIDLIITGRNGDQGSDKIFDQLDESIFSGKDSVNYKQLCGDYPTSTGFALWLAANIIKTESIPEVLNDAGSKGIKPKRILVYNHYQNIHHSLFLVSAC